ncbi:hypothetical protein Tco_0794347 [Tanacetum coccineum]
MRRLIRSEKEHLEVRRNIRSRKTIRSETTTRREKKHLGVRRITRSKKTIRSEKTIRKEKAIKSDKNHLEVKRPFETQPIRMEMLPFGRCPEGNGDISSVSSRALRMFIEQSHDEVYGCLNGGSRNSGGNRLAISMVEEAWLSEKKDV